MLDAVFRAVGFGLCHQLPERSFFAGGYQLPVCARDTGIYAGFAMCLLVLLAIGRGRRPTELPRWPVLVLMGAFVLAMAADGVTSYLGLRQTTNDIRLVTGLMTGWALATITVPMLNAQLWTRSGHGRVLEEGGAVALWCASLAAAFVLLRWVLPLTGVLYPLLLTVAIVSTFVAVNLVLVTLLPPFERRARRLRDAWVAVSLAVLFSGVEIALAAGLRMLVEGLA